MSAPRIPRPCGSWPIAWCVSSSIPCVRKRSSARPERSITPSAAYCAPVSSAAVSSTRCNTASRDSSELIAIPVSISIRVRSSWVATPPLSLPSSPQIRGREVERVRERVTERLVVERLDAKRTNEDRYAVRQLEDVPLHTDDRLVVARREAQAANGG